VKKRLFEGMDDDEMEEIEVTIDLEEWAYRKLQDLLSDDLIDDLDQWNVFFNSLDGRLVRTGNHCRVRFIVPKFAPPQYTICLKKFTNDDCENGISRAEEFETDVSKELAEEILHNPWDFYKLAPEIVKRELSAFSECEFELLCDFHSQRRVYSFGKWHLEADECTLPDGVKFYQLELESDSADEARDCLEKKLKELDIPYKRAEFGKYTRLTRVTNAITNRLQAVIDENSVRRK
jgi:uncharacterized protein YjbK